jgi:hypothetical protein
MFFMRILPAVLKELVTHVPTVLFEVTDWHELASELPKLSRKIIKKEGYGSLLHLQKSYLKPAHIQLVEKLDSHLPDRLSKSQGEQFLALYFSQLFSPHGIFLDLRKNHFALGNDTELQWHPPALWVRFGETFREGLLDIYNGFYFQDDALYYKGLVKAGLMSTEWSMEDRQKLGELFKGQFGSSLTSEMRFTLEGFKSSMMTIADFWLEKKVKISKDFLYLGIYLVTLYSALEDVEEPLAVRDIYLQVQDRFKEA